jgi:hypothetical protein
MGRSVNCIPQSELNSYWDESLISLRVDLGLSLGPVSCPHPESDAFLGSLPGRESLPASV